VPAIHGEHQVAVWNPQLGFERAGVLISSTSISALPAIGRTFLASLAK
jgi:hypothetical protein